MSADAETLVAEGSGGEPDHLVQTEHRVTPLELFFDLVFVFALTQVTTLMSNDPTWGGFGRGLLLLGALWWAWVAYAWLTNTIDPDEGGARLTMLAVMGATLVAALAGPGAFGANALIFGLAFLAVRALHILLYALATDDVGVKGAVYRLAPTAVGAPLLIVIAAAFDGWIQGGLWALALVIDYVGPALGRGRGWRVHPSHFAERHGLIVIIALGESIVAIGVGATGIGLDAGVLAAAIIGLVVAAALWWAYFDVVALVAERKLREATGVEQNLLARDTFSYLHLPIVAGIVLVALGIKKTLAHVGDPLDVVPAVALCAGPAIYFLGHIGMRLRSVGTVNRRRLATAALCLAVIPIATEASALAALCVIAALCTGLVAYEAIRYRSRRDTIRHGGIPAPG
ncbi:MAG TPA: low temperature requirement protein A [Gaiellaceae bacterium]